MSAKLRTPSKADVRDGIDIHPAADLFPMISEAELDELALEIAENGLHEMPVGVSTPSGLKLLDDRNRIAAICRIDDPERRDELRMRVFTSQPLNILPTSVDPYAYVVSANLRRRHLSGEQKRDAIAALLKVNPERSDRAVVKLSQASPTTVGTIRYQLEEAGDVSKLDTRHDARGRHQPAHKSAAKPTAFAALKPSVPLARPTALAVPKPSVPAPQNRSRAIGEFCALLRPELGTTLDDLVRILHDEQARMGEVPHYKRVNIARGYLNAPGVSFDDLRPLPQDPANV